MPFTGQYFLDDLEIDEPSNFSDVKFSIVRDEDMHGIGFEASVDSLNFYGAALDYIEEQYLIDGLKADITFKAVGKCNPEEDFQTVIEGKLNIGLRKKQCGTDCFVAVPVETVSCEQLINNRMDQQVDVRSMVASDGITALPGYADLGILLNLPTRQLDYHTEGVVVDDGYEQGVKFPSPGGGSEAYATVRPDYAKNTIQNVNDSHMINGVNVGYHGPSGDFLPISNQVLFNETNIKCFTQPFVVNGRLKGNITMPGVSNLDVYAVFLRGELLPQWPINDPNQLIDQVFIGTMVNPSAQPFDVTFPTFNWTPKDNGADGIYMYIALHQHPGANFDGTVVFDPESFFSCVTLKTCPPTLCPIFPIHETLSRIIENITNRCCRVKSEYYGRTDSEPFDFADDGCGGLRGVTSGLLMRNAPNGGFFTSFGDLIKGLRAIDNIGIGVEIDPIIPNRYVLRVEALDFFYEDVEILRHDNIPNGSIETQQQLAYSIINAGYKNWKTQDNFGLDEYNSERQYRTSLTNINNTLDISCDIVVGEYAIEITREQQFADTSAADTSYDDNTFLVCLSRNGIYGYAYGGLQVEQGDVDTPMNIFSPASVYNYRISPIRNLMRWFRTIAAAYPNIVDSDNQLFFNSGTGNYAASGRAVGGGCIIEAGPMSESQTIGPNNFFDATQAKPLWRPEYITYEYPMSLKDYYTIKARPYGYISYQCGENNPFEKGFIQEVQYQPVTGVATIKLKKKWD